MKNPNISLNNIILQLKTRIHLVVLLISLISLLFIFLRIIDFNSASGISKIAFLDGIFHLMVYTSTGFSLLFLPMYPIIFFIFKENNLNILERIAISIVTNLSFYIIVGIAGFYIGFALTDWFFFIILLISYFLLIFTSSIIHFKKGKSNIFKRKFTNDYKERFKNDFSLVSFIRKFNLSNSVLLITFISLICILGILGTRIFIGTDPWMHISIIRFITDINSLPLSDYFGTFGFHIFGAVIHFFSGLDIFLIPRFFVFYTFPISSLLVYILLMRIFRNKNLAILGIFILVFSSLGFLNMMFQFWPTSFAIILGITLFFFLYIRLQAFTQEAEPDKRQIFSNMFFSYFIFILIYISCLLIHSLIAVILLASYIWVYLIYFVRNYKRGFDFILLGVCLSIFFIFLFLDISTGHFIVFTRLSSISWYFILFGIIGIGFLEGLILFHYRKSMIFTKGRYSSILRGEKYKFINRIEKKFIYPFIFALTIILMSVFAVFNALLFKFDFISIFTGFEIVIIWSFAVWGLLIFQFKPRGKPLFLWGLALVIILIVGFSFDVISGSLTFFSRISYLASIIVAIGFVSYFYKIIKTNSVHKLKIKAFLIFLTTFSLFATYLELNSSVGFFSLKSREVSTIQWYSNYSSDQNVIIGEFGWSSIFIYYGYPFDQNNETRPLNSVTSFYTATNEFLNPQLHIYNSTNLLSELKVNSSRDVFLIVTDNYLLVSGFELFGKLTNEEIEMYYSLLYLNRICSSKSSNGKITPYYWVI
jgi:hypothetical protein